ncbi:MAG: flagellar motor switch protein FliM [Bacteroidota bacterium]
MPDAPDQPLPLDPTDLDLLHETLGEDEIDALLQMRSAIGVDSAPIDFNLLDELAESKRHQAVTYDFRRPRLFSLDQTRVLQYVHESFARDLSVYLSAQLRTMVEITLSAVQQLLYSEYVASSVAPSALYIGEARGQRLEHQFILELDSRFGIYMIEKLFGGPGQFPAATQEASQIEQRIIGRVVRRAFDELETSWERLQEIKLREVAFESNAEFVQILPSMEPVLVAAFDLQVQGHVSFVKLCYPYLMLEHMMGHAGMQRWMSSKVTAVPPETRARYERALRTMDVELRAELGRTRLSIHDLTTLQEGDVIPLQRRTQEPVQVFIGEHEKFSAVAGHAGQQRALRILDVAQPAAFPPTA